MQSWLSDGYAETDVDRNTYDFFEMEHGVPTYAYDYETAVYRSCAGSIL